jgi:hypothetical protein
MKQKEVNIKMQEVDKKLSQHIPNLSESKAYRIINKELYYKIYYLNEFIALHGSETQQLSHFLTLWLFYFKVKVLINEGLTDQTNLGLCTTFIKKFAIISNYQFNELQAQLVTLSQTMFCNLTPGA